MTNIYKNSSYTSRAYNSYSLSVKVKAGQTVGTLNISLHGEVLKTVDLVSQDTIDGLTDAEKEELDASSMTGILKKVGIGAAIVILVLILLICITRTIGYLQYKKRRKNRRRRRNSSRRRR